MPVSGKCRKFGFPPSIRRYPHSLYCGAVFADGITSANVVGYQTSALLPNDYTMFGIQFQGVDGGSIKFKDLSGNFFGSTETASADNILVWKTDGYHTYYYGDWGADAEKPSWNNVWYNDETGDDASNEEIPVGAACWYLRYTDTATTISFASPLAE